MPTRITLAAVAALTLAACTDSRTPAPLAPTDTHGSRAARGETGSGAVYTLTNGTAGNAVIAFRRAADGSLTRLGSVSTGGLGTGGAIDPLASQYALVLSDDDRLLFAVNAGSNDV